MQNRSLYFECFEILAAAVVGVSFYNSQFHTLWFPHTISHGCTIMMTVNQFNRWFCPTLVMRLSNCQFSYDVHRVKMSRDACMAMREHITKEIRKRKVWMMMWVYILFFMIAFPLPSKKFLNISCIHLKAFTQSFNHTQIPWIWSRNHYYCLIMIDSVWGPLVSPIVLYCLKPLSHKHCFSQQPVYDNVRSSK